MNDPIVCMRCGDVMLRDDLIEEEHSAGCPRCGCVEWKYVAFPRLLDKINYLMEQFAWGVIYALVAGMTLYVFHGLWEVLW